MPFVIEGLMCRIYCFLLTKEGAKETKENEWKLMNQEGRKADGKYFCFIISQTITLLQVSTVSCHP
jgi:hypothetical protein